MRNPVRIFDRAALRLYVAGVVATGLEFVCHLCNHYPLPCWWTNNRLYRWADGVCNPADGLDPSCCNALLTGSGLRCNQPVGHGGLHAYSVPGFSYYCVYSAGAA